MIMQLGQAWRDSTGVIYPTGSIIEVDDYTASELEVLRYATRHGASPSDEGESAVSLAPTPSSGGPLSLSVVNPRQRRRD